MRVATPLYDIRPTEPPGRSNRKARGYGEQIRRLAAEGYSLALIRDALAKAGIEVSRSTVQREASRPPSKDLRQHSPSAAPESSPSALNPHPPTNSVARAPEPVPAPVRGKDVAEAFMSGRITNPLLRKDKP